MRKFLFIFSLLLFCGLSNVAYAATINVPADHATIQAAVDAAASNDTIIIASGTYTEQVSITKSLTLQGAGQALTTIRSIPSLATTFSNKKPIVSIVGPDIVVNINNLTVDGRGFGNANNVFVGIGYRSATGTIDHVTVKGVRNDPLDAIQGGIGIYFSNIDFVPRNATITNSIIFDYQKTGIVGNELGLDLYIHGNTITGAGGTADSVAIAQNGIQIGFGANATITGNTIIGNECDNPLCGADPLNEQRSFGILATDFADDLVTLGEFTISDNILESNDTSIFADGTTTISGNEFVSNRYENLFLSQGTHEVSDNTFDNGNTGILVVSYDSAIYDASVHITGNTITGVGSGIQIIDQNDADTEDPIVTIDENFISADTDAVTSTTDLSLSATPNWWGTANATIIASKITGSSATYTPYYLNPGKTILNTALSGGTLVATSNNLDLPTESGLAAFPAGTTSITLGNSSSINLTSNINNVSGGSVSVRGSTATLSSYSGGNISADLSAPVAVGPVTVTVGKAVALSSGVSGQPIIVNNTSLGNASLSIPDNTAIFAASGWDGTIAPPTVGSTSGTLPDGYESVSNVIEAGSSTSTILFDKATTLTLTGVTGEVGYKPAGATSWTKISTTCGGNYASPTSPVFPGECSISDGNNTKILTYHLTSFGELDAVGGGSYGGSYIAPSVVSLPTLPPVIAIANNSQGCANGNTYNISTGEICVNNSTSVQATTVPRGESYDFGTSTLRNGSTGEAVRELQRFLNATLSLGLVVDGKLGPKTISVIKKWQKSQGLVADGLIGPKTKARMLSSL